MKETKVYIVKSAIRYNDKVYTGFDHGECFKQIDKDTIKDYDKLEQGFITDKNEFVDRQQALDIAYKAGQIPYEKNNHCLISEDVHLYWLNDLQSQLDQQKAIWQKLKEWLNDRMEHYNDCLNENVLISSEREEVLCARYNQCYETIAQMEYIEKELEGENE